MTAKPEHVKRQRTPEEWRADRRFYRRLGWSVAIFGVVAFVGVIWIMVEESTKPERIADPFPAASVWQSR